MLSVQFFFVSFVLMDSSFESFGEIDLLAAFAVCPVREFGGAVGLPPDECSSRVPPSLLTKTKTTFQNYKPLKHNTKLPIDWFELYKNM